MQVQQIDKAKKKSFKKNTHHLSKNFHSVIVNRKDNTIIDRIQLYIINRLESANFIEEFYDAHDKDRDVKTAINKEILLQIYRANKDKNDTDKLDDSWLDAAHYIHEDGKKKHKKILRITLHVLTEIVCAMICFAMEHILEYILDHIAGSEHEHSHQVGIFVVVFITAIVLSLLMHHAVPELFFSKENERKNCLIGMQKEILEEKLNNSGRIANPDLADIAKIYCQVMYEADESKAGLVSQEIGKLQLYKKNILEAYKELNEFLWEGKTKNKNVDNNVDLSSITIVINPLLIETKGS